MKYFPDKYTLRARVFPTTLGVLPFIFIFKFVPIDTIFLKITVGGVVSSALIYLATHAIRIPAKMFEDWLFSSGLHMPTTNLLLYRDSYYDEQTKDKIRLKIKSDFDITLFTKDEEVLDEVAARRKIKDATKFIINRIKDGHLVLKHNYEYGFFRNFWSASIVGLFSSILLLLVSLAHASNLFVYLALFLSVLYMSYIMFGFLLIRYVGTLYARKLIEEYYES